MYVVRICHVSLSSVYFWKYDFYDEKSYKVAFHTATDTAAWFFSLSLCFLLLLIFVLVVGDLDDQAMVRCG